MNQQLQSKEIEILNMLPTTSFIFRLNTEGRYLEVCTPPDASRLWMPAEQHIGKLLEDVLPPVMAAPRRFYFEQALATKETQLYGYPHPITVGRWMACQLMPVLDSNGEPYEVVMEVYDIAAFSRLGAPYIQR